MTRPDCQRVRRWTKVFSSLRQGLLRYCIDRRVRWHRGSGWTGMICRPLQIAIGISQNQTVKRRIAITPTTDGFPRPVFLACSFRFSGVHELGCGGHDAHGRQGTNPDPSVLPPKQDGIPWLPTTRSLPVQAWGCPLACCAEHACTVIRPSKTDCSLTLFRSSQPIPLIFCNFTVLIIVN